ncbi:serine carboxypeptidase-like protein [Striga asiatica]|uniref:Carboxypeptidase n=1 Tax=Striga asiatica TaxID=4170 RepID=A0A5A7RHN8_STRAF|nr:serine carboxypeptidase-like protein [Striga asiatica]
MNFFTFLFLSILCLPCYTECHSARGHNNLLRDLLKTRKLRKQPYNYRKNDSPVYVAPQEGMKEADKIVALPGQQQLSVKFSQYSGYVTVDSKAGRALFYYFTEAEEPANKPLVLWLNGGPGCSSIGGGAFTAQGPFRVNPDGKTLWYNKYAWNIVANVIFLESPAGVGFSYSNTTSDYVTGDEQTAKDSYTFLVNWLERFPEYKTREFYLAGESYAGHYVPQLADLILENNKITNHTVINLKGLAIGNAYIDFVDRWSGTLDHFWTSALISEQTHDGIVKNCNYSLPDPFEGDCEKYIDEAYKEKGNIDIYDIYAPLCGSPSTAPSISSYDPCSTQYVIDYLNRPDVQKALHANITGIPGLWSDCSDFVFDKWKWNESADTVLPIIEKLMSSHISVWIYSGDTDGIIPVTTTKYSMAKLSKRVITPWFPWWEVMQLSTKT